MKGGVFLAHLDSGQTAYLLIGAIEGGDELLLVVVLNVELQTQAHAVAFQGALPDSFGGGDGIGRLSCASTRGLTMKN